MKLKSGLLLAVALAAMPILARAEDQPAASSAAMNTTPVDPARLAAAREIAGVVLPPGTYAKVMDATMSRMIGPITDSMFALPVADLAGMSGARPEDLRNLGKASTAEIMGILDPHFRERTQRTMSVMMTEISSFSASYEPAIREGLAEAYAQRFDKGQLAELARFFATPTGHAFASLTMTIGTDPAVMAKMQDMMPAMMKQLPAIMQKAQAATADLPPPRKVDQLSPAERAKLQKLLGGNTGK